MPISDIVSIVVSLQAAQALAAGFGVPLVLGAHTRNTDRIRFYSSQDALTADGFDATDASTSLVASIFSQNPAPSKVAVGRRANRPTMRWAITPVAANSTIYKLTVVYAGVSYPVTFTSDASGTVAEIIAGLKAAIDALALGLTTTDQTTYLRIAATAVGAYFAVYVDDPSLLGIAQDNPDAGVAADLDAINLVDSSWYCILSPYKSAAENAAIAAWTESHAKLFLAETQDSEVITHALSGATDIANTLKAAAYTRSPIAYHHGDGTNLAAAWAGKCLPYDPGSETWKFKTLAGVTPSRLNDTHLANLRAKNCNFYYTVAGINMTAEGTVPSGDWIDTTRGVDWLRARMGERIVTALANARKVPYTDTGAVVLETEVRAQLQDGVDVGLLRADPKPTVTVPSVASQSTANRQARNFPNITFVAQLAGAVHKVGVSGTVTP